MPVFVIAAAIWLAVTAHVCTAQTRETPLA
jgi:hypothetical protein